METLDTLGQRIATTEEIRGIVRTMKSLSLVSIQQYERAMEALAVYRETVDLGFMALLRRTGPDIIAADRAGGASAAIVFGSDRGLCGRFNERVAERVAADLTEAGGTPLLVVGTRMAGLLEERGLTPEEIYFLPGSARGLTRSAQSILICADRWRREKGVDRIDVYHNRRSASLPAEPVRRTLLPLAPEALAALAARPWPARPIPDFRMAPGAVFAWLVREHLMISVIEAGAQSLASEHAARLAAMRAAERNIDDRLALLSASFRRTRQEAITSEILDIVAGVEAMRPARAGPDDPDDPGRPAAALSPSAP